MCQVAFANFYAQRTRTSAFPSYGWSGPGLDHQRQLCIWYSQKGQPSTNTAHERMKPVFAGAHRTVHSFWSRIVSPIPREQIFFSISSFGDRFVEDIYFFEDSTSSGIHIFDVHRKQEIIFKDFISYPTKFPFQDPSSLVRPDSTATEILQMHQWTLQRRNASCMGRRFLVNTEDQVIVFFLFFSSKFLLLVFFFRYFSFVCAVP